MIPLPRALAVLLTTVAVAAVSGCGEEEELAVTEGEPLELGDVSYNVQVTRFLNPGDPEDQAYLTGQEQLPASQAYLGVFLTIENEGSEAVEVPEGVKVTDTQDNEFEPIESDSPFALPLPGQSGTTGAQGTAPSDEQPSSIEAGGELPEPDTIPAYGPIGGAMLLFRVDEAVTENRPLELEIPGDSGETGMVELDI